MKLKGLSKSEAGFTLIELLIATSIFTMVLLIITFSIIEIGRIYISGLIGSQTQNSARSIIDQLGQSIQLTSPGTGTSIVTPRQIGSTQQYWFCANGDLYTYVLNQELTSSGSPVFTENAPSGGCNNGTAPTGVLPGKELLSQNMRLTNFSLTQPDLVNDPNLYSINLRIIYGSDGALNATQTSCLPFDSGGAFCNIVPFTATVQDRL